MSPKNPRPFQEGERITLTPTRLGSRDEALAEYEGWRVRVQGGIPGEAAHVRVLHVSKGGPMAVARFLEPVGDAHPARRPPPCPIHGPCGGCGWQHVHETAAFQMKIDAAGRLFPETAFEAGITSPRAFAYRAKAFLLPQMQKGRLVFGARPPRGEKLVDTTGCEVLRPELERIAEAARAFLSDGRDVKELRSILLRGNRQGETQFTLVHRDESTRWVGLAGEIARRGGAQAAFVQHHPAPGNRVQSDEEEVLAFGSGPLHERFSGLEVVVPPTAFCQGNPGVADKLYGAIAERVTGSRVVELFCGTGVAGLLALVEDDSRTLLGVDLAPRAVAAAKQNAEHNGLAQRCEFRAADASTIDLSGADTLLVNPPRAGCSEAICKGAVDSGAASLLYLSCNAETLARDIERMAGGGFRLESLIPADMFPQTPHLEVLATLRR
ncbi:MAG: methyltransferase domain-containing protein [Planctomycetota bacterium]